MEFADDNIYYVTWQYFKNFELEKSSSLNMMGDKWILKAENLSEIIKTDHGKAHTFNICSAGNKINLNFVQPACWKISLIFAFLTTSSSTANNWDGVAFRLFDHFYPQV